MTMIVDGEIRPEAREPNDDAGEYQREPSIFRDWIGTDYPAEPDRYHLYVSRACPWAHGAVLTRSLMGLDEAISMDILDPYRERKGWQFTPKKHGCTPDTVNGYDYLYEVYTAADPEYTGRVSVPVLWDREEETIVNNESIEIMKMLATAFNEDRGQPIDLYPEGLRAAIDRIVEDLYDAINNGVYRVGFARTQSAYDRAVTQLFDALDRWESVLAEQRYLAGDMLTLADLRFFATLVRFDTVYHTHFKCNKRRIVDYPNLWNYTRELYQVPEIGSTVEMAHINEHYYRTHTSLNPSGIIPIGPELDFETPHDRDRLAGKPPIPTKGNP